jgi:hypothetical protein
MLQHERLGTRALALCNGGQDLPMLVLRHNQQVA